jgi:hypothetical protein
VVTGAPVMDGGLTDCEAVVLGVLVEVGEDGFVDSPELPQADSTVASVAHRKYRAKCAASRRWK